MLLKTTLTSLIKSRLSPGVTLIEVFVALIILTSGLLGIAGLTAATIRGNFFSKNVTSATAIAQTQLDAVENAGYFNVNTTNFPSTAVNLTMGGVTFARTTTITTSSPGANMKTILVAVTWNEAANAARSVSLSTILAQ
jgi:Tfp pilus assembly protein PilV